MKHPPVGLPAGSTIPKKEVPPVRMSLCLVLLTVLAASAGAQTHDPRPADVASPEAIVEAAYASIARRPGEPFDWDRFRSLFLPGARLVPNTEQIGGDLRVLTPDDFVAWIDPLWDVDDPEDPGFEEEQVAVEIERYGDVAHAFSTYRKHLWGSDEILGQGINSFQLVRSDGRWWIAGIVWDEESGAGPIPEAYLGDGGGDDAAPGADPVASEDVEAMDVAYARFVRAYQMAEPDSVVALYTGDPLYLPAGGDVRRGRKALRREFGFLDAIRERGGRALLDFETLDRGVSDGLAYDVGYYRLRVERADGTTTPVSRGKFATIWKRDQKGQWRIHVDSFSPAPVEGGEEAGR